MAVTAGLTVTDLVESILVHPALSEALAEAAEYANQLAESEQLTWVHPYDDAAVIAAYLYLRLIVAMWMSTEARRPVPTLVGQAVRKPNS